MKQFLRVKEMAGHTFSRSGKLESLSDELLGADRKVEQMKTAVQILCKKLGPTSGSIAQSQDPSLKEKKLKKLPEYILGTSLIDEKTFEDDTLFKYILNECGSTEIQLAKHIAERDIQVEQWVFDPFNSINSEDIPNISKSKKSFTRFQTERESANNRYQSLLRQNDPNFPNPKVKDAKDELEEAEMRLDQAKDTLAAEMFSLLSKEMDFAKTMLQYLKLQRGYHENAMHTLMDIIPKLEKHINDSTVKPVFRFPIEEHLRVTGRTIAYPIELCVCSLHELGLMEEGLLRIAAGSTRMKRMKLSLDAGVFKLPLSLEYRDVHAIAGVLKTYLRELPEPLLTHRLYDSFISAVTQHTTEDARIQALWDVVYQLPEENLNNLRYLIKFLATLTKNHTTNKMTPANIAIVVAPNLLRSNDDTNGIGFTMTNTSNINCVIELLVKHGDWFFKDDINFFQTFTKEELLPDLYEYGFSPNFGTGIYNHSYNPIDPPNGDGGMSKSMFEYAGYNSNTTHNTENMKFSVLDSKQSHSRSSSHDTSLILVDNEIKRTQSNSSLSENSSPPPVIRRSKKTLAPLPPTSNASDKNISTAATNAQSKDANKNLKISNEPDKPDKPPRPVPNELPKPAIGVQTINRATYKNKQRNPAANKLSSSRENLTDTATIERKNMFDLDDKVPLKKNDPPETVHAVNSVQSIIVQHGTVNKMTVSPEHSITISAPVISKPPQIATDVSKDISRPVAAPRTFIPAVKTDLEPDIALRPKSSIDLLPPAIASKPVIPERPAGLRPQSFRATMHKNSSLEMLNITTDTPQTSNNSSGETLLERIHVYSVDKQQPTIIHVGAGRLSEPCASNPDDTNKSSVARVSAVDGETQIPEKSAEQNSLTSQMRKMSQSEGNILDVPPSPRMFHKPPPRPQIPAPPPPTAYVSQRSSEVIESTNL